MIVRRLAASALAVSLVFGVLPVLATPVAATGVADDASFRAAWEDPNESLITLTGDISLACTGTPPTRSSATPIVVDGAGHTLHNSCVDQDGLLQTGSGSVTLRSLVFSGLATTRNGLEATSAVVIENSTVSGHGGDGVDSTGAITLTNATISNNGQDGIDSDSGATATVTGSTVSGNGDDGIELNGDVTVSSSTITENSSDGIFVSGAGSATITGSSISNNQLDGIAVSGDGGVSLTLSTVAGNGADGIDPDGAGATTVTTSTISGNAEDGIDGDAQVTVTASTLTGNGEAGAYAIGNATILNATVTDNGTYGIFGQADVDVTNSTLTGNATNVGNVQVLTIHLASSVLVDATVANCEGPAVVDEGHNFVDDGSCGSIAANAADPALGALAANGGATQTRAPAETSPLVDAVPEADCDVATDQRGVSRPQGNGCDIGAVELVVEPDPTPTFSDIAESPFKEEIEWLAAEGITLGCGDGKFCPNARVTREQMASFLVRALGLTAGAGADLFTDDDASTHEDDIDRLATAGITKGCGGTKFCPSASVLREQMASFLVRALGLTAGAGADLFTDDDASTHEDDIDRLATAGITKGCGGTKFCPSAVVTREQMAAFLYRAFSD